MPDWKRSRDRPPKTWLKQITVDLDTTAADRPTWTTAVAKATRLRAQ